MNGQKVSQQARRCLQELVLARIMRARCPPPLIDLIGNRLRAARKRCVRPTIAQGNGDRREAALADNQLENAMKVFLRENEDRSRCDETATLRKLDRRNVAALAAAIVMATPLSAAAAGKQSVAGWQINPAERSSVDCRPILKQNAERLRELIRNPSLPLSRRNLGTLTRLSKVDLDAAIRSSARGQRLANMKNCIEGRWACQAYRTTLKDLRFRSTAVTVISWKEAGGGDHGLFYSFANDDQTFPGPLLGVVPFRGRSIVVTETGAPNVLLSSVVRDGQKPLLSVECAAGWRQ